MQTDNEPQSNAEVTTQEPPATAFGPRRWLVLAGVIAVALNLRTTITVVGPLVPTIREALDVGNVAMGAVGTIPLLAFGLVAPLAPRLARRVGIGRSLAGSMVLLALATGMRSLGGYGWLLLGTAIIGVAIAIGNVLVPALIKLVFPDRVGALTSLYGTVMIVAASVSAGVAVPVADARGWPTSLGIWALPALMAAGVVAASLWVDARASSPEQRADADAARRSEPSIPAAVMHRSPLAWHVTAFMGLQSILFFVTLTWLPDVLIERGMTDLRAGAMVSVLNVGGLLGVLIAPAVAGRRADQRWYGAASGALTVVGLALLLPDGITLAPIGSLVFGLGAGSTIGLALTFMSLRTATARDAAALSGMAQTWGYLVSAAGPLAWGALRELSGSWTLPLVLLLAVALATTAAGYLAGRDRMLVLPADA